MKRSILIGELSDFINDLDNTNHQSFTLTPMKSLSLQDLLVQVRKELINIEKDQANEEPSQTKKQVQTEILKQMTRLGIKKQ